MITERFSRLAEPMNGLVVYQLSPVGDKRGSLTRLYCPEGLAETPFVPTIKQINLTRTVRKGTVRGLHFQHPPYSEDKFLICLRGSVLDFVVDLRLGSPSFLRVHKERLSANNSRALMIPKGFAHGFQTLTDDCDLLYLHSAQYNPEAEGGLNILDPKLAINLPLPVAERSRRDEELAMLADDFAGLSL